MVLSGEDAWYFLANELLHKVHVTRLASFFSRVYPVAQARDFPPFLLVIHGECIGYRYREHADAWCCAYATTACRRRVWRIVWRSRYISTRPFQKYTWRKLQWNHWQNAKLRFFFEKKISSRDRCSLHYRFSSSQFSGNSLEKKIKKRGLQLFGNWTLLNIARLFFGELNLILAAN